MSRLWDKGVSVDEAILRFTVGEDPVLDRRLVPYDVRASIAHVQMLGAVGHLSESDTHALVQTLEAVLEAFRRGEWTIELAQEDCHTALEAQLVARAGVLGEKVHLGRSRNDQVLVALRLYLLDAIDEVRAALAEVEDALLHLEHAQGEIAIPGYTHMQQAMPSTVGLWAAGHCTVLSDSRALLDAAHVLADQNPLGSAAGYGTPGLVLDREITTAALGFVRTQAPATACQLSRGRAEGALAFAISEIVGDLGRIASDLCLYATQEFALVRLAADISTGSSIMPQKRNPDVFELVRGHSAQAPADLMAILELTRKLPSGYHRDLQLMKAPLFRLIDRGVGCLRIMAHALGRIEFDAARATAITDSGIHAAERAFALVQSEGISFREAYRRVAADCGQ